MGNRNLHNRLNDLEESGQVKGPVQFITIWHDGMIEDKNTGERLALEKWKERYRDLEDVIFLRVVEDDPLARGA